MREKLNALYQALNTLTISGYRDCKTYANCMEFLAQIIQECEPQPQPQPEEVETDEK